MSDTEADTGGSRGSGRPLLPKSILGPPLFELDPPFFGGADLFYGIFARFREGGPPLLRGEDLFFRDFRKFSRVGPPPFKNPPSAPADICCKLVLYLHKV